MPGFFGSRRAAPICSLHEERRYRALFENIPIGLYVTAPSGAILDVNAELARMLGYPDRRALIGLDVTGIYADSCDRDRAIEALKEPGAVFRSEVRLRARSGAVIVAQDMCCAVRDPQEGLLYYEGSLQDITDAKRLEEELRSLARHDPLTGLYNRHALSEILVAEAVRSRRYGHPIGMLMIDVDRLKEFNDRLGHAAGDEVLRDVASLITRSVRDSDIVVRYGGDEFLVVLIETNGQALRVKERIECELASELGASRYGIPVTASIGAAFWSPDSEESVSMLIARADKAMYAAKGERAPV
jgi:diguanylate cyclase (GGDEF)-like protein/PAS domain S-box-containing protein